MLTVLSVLFAVVSKARCGCRGSFSVQMFCHCTCHQDRIRNINWSIAYQIVHSNLLPLFAVFTWRIASCFRANDVRLRVQKIKIKQSEDARWKITTKKKQGSYHVTHKKGFSWRWTERMCVMSWDLWGKPDGWAQFSTPQKKSLLPWRNSSITKWLSSLVVVTAPVWTHWCWVAALSDPLASDSGCGGDAGCGGNWACGGDVGCGRNTGCGGSVGCGADGSFRAVKLTCPIVWCGGDTVCGGNAGCSGKAGCGRDGSLSVGILACWR